MGHPLLKMILGATIAYKLAKKLSRHNQCGPECGPAQDHAPGACGHRWGGGWRWGRHHSHGHHRGPFGRRWLWHVSEELQLSPAQERALVEALDAARRLTPLPSPEAMRQGIDNLAQVLAGASFSEETLQGHFARHDEQQKAARHAFREALRTLHEVLTPSQRERIASFLRQGPRPIGVPFGPW
jgi:Spy/CpxP family protein refolding chaperone